MHLTGRQSSALRRVLAWLLLTLSVSPSFCSPLNPYSAFLGGRQLASSPAEKGLSIRQGNPKDTSSGTSNKKQDTYVLYPIHDEANAGFDKHAYSQFKYGAYAAAKQYGREMADMLWKEVVKPLHDKERAANQPVTTIASVVTRGSLPTAAYTLETYFIRYLNRHLAKENSPAAVRFKSTKATSASQTGDYATMSQADRDRIMNEERFTFDREGMKGMLLVSVDDIFITGSHERPIRKMFKDDLDNGWYKGLIFVYISKVMNKNIDPAIETRLNEVAVPNFADFKAIIEAPLFTIENRFVKRMLKASRRDLAALFDSLDKPKDFAQALYDGAILNDFHVGGDIYKANLQLVQQKAGL